MPKTTTTTQAPDEAELLAMLGTAKREWDAFLAAIELRCPSATREWKRYAGPSGLQLVVKHKGRNLVYLKPAKGGFSAAFALSEAAIAAAANADLPKEFVAALGHAPRFREGVPARIQVHSRRDLRTAVELLRLKLDS